MVKKKKSDYIFISKNHISYVVLFFLTLCSVWKGYNDTRYNPTGGFGGFEIIVGLVSTPVLVGFTILGYQFLTYICKLPQVSPSWYFLATISIIIACNLSLISVIVTGKPY